MSPLFSPLNSYGVLFAGVVVAVLSLLSLLRRPGVREGTGAWLVGLCLGGAGAVAFFASAGPMAIALAVLGGVLALGCLLRTEAPGRLIASALRALAWRRVQALFLLVTSLAGAFGWVIWLDKESTPEIITGPLAQGAAERPSLQRLSLVAWTDRDSTVPLYRPNGVDDTTLGPSERRLGQGPFSLRLIATGGRTVESNCHGWVFAGNRFWLMGKDVERILVDNDYGLVTDPVTGDLVIYRDASGAIVHSAIVRGQTGNGQMLVESKWGRRGCYVHEPKIQPFGERFEYYRSPRKGHRLSGTEVPYPPPGTSDLRL
ncbi:MAG: hypothetical protein HYS12_07900 [Planctomycetes bacterium]|nr:hypothetical protein [Planctomycetota bacterium]